MTVAKLKRSTGYCIEPNEKLAAEAVRKIKEYNLENLLTVINTHWRDSEVKQLLSKVTVTYVYSLDAELEELSDLLLEHQQSSTLVVSYIRPLFQLYLGHRAKVDQTLVKSIDLIGGNEF